jgi:anti-sigma factor RsiW
MAMNKKMLDREPSEIEMLLPFHAAGTLNARESRRVEEALARDLELARQYAVVREEYAGTIHLNESLGAPSARAMHKLFAAIDAEPRRKSSALPNFSARATAFFASLSPRTLAWSGIVGAVLLLLQAGVIGAVLVKNQPSSYQTASLSDNAPITRSLGAGAAPSALVRFAPDARAAEITALLDKYQASVVDGPKGGLFQLQFGKKAMTKDEVASVLTKLQSEKIVSLAVATP